MAKILKPILLVTIVDPEPDPAASPSGGSKGYNGLGVHRKEVENEAAAGLAKLEEDLTPKLGGDLDAAGKDIKNAKQIIFGNSDLMLMYVDDYTDPSNYQQSAF